MKLNKTKRLLAGLMSMLMVTSTMPVSVFAEDETESVITIDENGEVTSTDGETQVDVSTGDAESAVEPETTDETEVTEEVTEETSTENMPAFEAKESVDNFEITVSAPEGVFPEGSSLKVTKEEAIDAITSDAKVAKQYVFDISILNAEGEEIEPTDEGKVSVKFKNKLVANENLETNVYHIVDDNPVEMNVKSVEDEAEFETDSFSTYVMEFTYDELSYALNGETSIDIDDLLAAFGLAGTVNDVTSENEDIISVAKNDNDSWTLTVLQEFETAAINVDIDGIDYGISLTEGAGGAGATAHYSGGTDKAGIVWIVTDNMGATADTNTMASYIRNVVHSTLDLRSYNGGKYGLDAASSDVATQAMSMCYTNHLAQGHTKAFEARLVAVGAAYTVHSGKDGSGYDDCDKTHTLSWADSYTGRGWIGAYNNTTKNMSYNGKSYSTSDTLWNEGVSIDSLALNGLSQDVTQHDVLRAVVLDESWPETSKPFDVVIHKSSTNSCTDGNSLYTTNGIVYDLKIDGTTVKQVTLQNGVGTAHFTEDEASNYNGKTIYAVESENQARKSSGYLINSQQYSVWTVSDEAGGTHDVYVQDTPIMDPVNVQIQKIDSITGESYDKIDL